MKLLPLNFRKNGYDYYQVWRDDKYAIYRQSSEGFTAYEVIKIGHNKAGERFGLWFEESEGYPSTEQWGTNGFTVATLADANIKVKQLKEISIAANTSP